MSLLSFLIDAPARDENGDILPHRRAQVHALQDEQQVYLQQAYQAIARRDEWGIKVANAAYNFVMKELRELLGPTTHCAVLDPDLWQHYSDLYKDHYGVRPRDHMTHGEVRCAYEKLAAMPFDED